MTNHQKSWEGQKKIARCLRKFNVALDKTARKKSTKTARQDVGPILPKTTPTGKQLAEQKGKWITQTCLHFLCIFPPMYGIVTDKLFSIPWFQAAPESRAAKWLARVLNDCVANYIALDPSWRVWTLSPHSPANPIGQKNLSAQTTRVTISQ